MLEMLSLLFDTKTILEEAFEQLQGGVWVHKQLQQCFIKSGLGNYLGLSWEGAKEKLGELEAGDNLMSLSAIQLSAFPAIIYGY